jgi:integrase/recombinase XerC
MTSGGTELSAYLRYMRRRRYSRETIWARMNIARRWTTATAWRSATFTDVEDFIADHDVSPATSRNMLTNLRAFYRWAIRHGLTEHDPTRLVDRWPVPHRLPRPARDTEIRTVLDVSDAQVTAMVALMACAGLRCCEVSRLDWADVDLAAATVTVTGKGDRQRVIHLSTDVVRLLAALDSADGPVFTGARSPRLSAARVSQTVCRAFRDAGSSVTAHQLRHRCATTALTLPGADLLAVRDLLGHSSVATTQIYTAVAAGRVADLSRALSLPNA